MQQMHDHTIITTATTFADSPATLMEHWRSLRRSLTNDLSDIVHMEMVTKFWSHAPLQKRGIDWDSPTSWPDPWTLLHNRDFDDSSISLGMFYTLLLSKDGRWSTDRLALKLINAPTLQIQKIILEIDHRWILNLEYNRVNDGDRSEQWYYIQREYDYDGKVHSFAPSRHILK
jgi:hypothetical protein